MTTKKKLTIPDLDRDLRQQQLEDWEEAYNAIPDDVRGKSRHNGAVIRAAIQAGWFLGDDLSVDDVGLLTFKQAKPLADEIYSLYNEVTEIPEKKS